MFVHPVLMAVSDSQNPSTPKERGARLSRLARRAVARSALYAGLELGRLEKDENGAPVPVNHVYWSLTHKTRWVGGVAASCPVGVDVEKIRPVSRGMFAKVAKNEEWDVMGGRETAQFFQVWTAKEAVLKASGKGLSGLSMCRVTDMAQNKWTLLQLRETWWHALHFQVDGHVAALARMAGTTLCEIHWHVDGP